MPVLIDFLVAALLLVGASFALLGAFGLVKLSSFYSRLHVPTKATTVGVGSILIASMLYFSLRGEGISLHELSITLFLFVTAPVSAHMMVKAALKLDPGARPEPPASAGSPPRR